MIDGNKLRKLRLSVTPYLSQSALADAIGITSSQIHKIESGKIKRPMWCTVYKISIYFNVSERDLRDDSVDCC